jgi:hypothetical protein
MNVHMPNPCMVTTNQAYGLNLEELQKAKFEWSHSMAESPSDHGKEDLLKSKQHNLSFLFSRESDEYGREVPPSDSYLARTLSEQTSLSTRAKRKRFSSSLQDSTLKANPSRLSKGEMEQWIHQYAHNSKPEHILYSTTSNQFGSKKPTLATLPMTRYDISQKFSSSFHTTMFSDHGLNIALSRSKVHKSLDPSFT